MRPLNSNRLADLDTQLDRRVEEKPTPKRPAELDILLSLLTEESDALAKGDFDTFTKLQGQKRAAIRAVERVARHKAQDLAPEDVVDGGLMDEVQVIATRNANLLDATRTAIQSVKSHAVGALEEAQGDGVYGRDLEHRKPKRLSTKRVHVKL